MIINLNNKYCNQASIEHRKSLGQFFTPPIVARLMCQWVFAGKRKNILDPSFGLGAFYDEAQKYYHDFAYNAYEIDSKIINFYKDETESFHDGLVLINQDYLDTVSKSFDGIICNPPYLRFQKFINRHIVLPKLKSILGDDILGYTNIASIFLLKSIYELGDNGRLAYIMPFEFMNTGYGKKIKQALIANGLLKHAIVFKNEREVFSDVITTVVILLCEKNNIAEDISFINVTSLEQCSSIESVLNLSAKKYTHNFLATQDKWGILFNETKYSFNTAKLVPLSYYGSFKRGIATGANEFFTFNKSQIESLSLPPNSYTKCITKSQQIRKESFTDSDLRMLIHNDSPVFVLDVKDPHNQYVAKYIKSGEEKGFNERYLTKMRRPWYRLEERKPAPILFGVFSRGEYKVIRNYTTALNLTCYHGFYQNIFGDNYLDLLYLFFISDIGSHILKQNQRKYGGDLDKFEPNDLNNTLVPCDSYLNELRDRIPPDIISSLKAELPIKQERINGLFNDLIYDEKPTVPDFQQYTEPQFQ